jgi:3-deoxy-D-manno-octulosonic-acid transferase
MSDWLYQTALVLARPLVHVRLWWRARREPEYGKRQAERFGHTPSSIRKYPIWFHTVSAGETIAAAPLIRDLAAHYSDLPFLVTTMTPTGSAQVQERLAEYVDHCYAPYDFKACVRRFFDTVQPRVLILMETELWPNIIAEAKRRGVPVMLINARLSQRSAQGYARLAKLTRSMLSNIEHIACQTPEHRDRFIGLGAAGEKVSVTGSVKYDISLPADFAALQDALRGQFGLNAQTPVWIAASTHPGEDEIVLEAHRILIQRIPGLRLLLVPRHPVRCDEVGVLIEAQDFTYVLQSESELNPPGQLNAEVILGDTMGTLLTLYGLAQVAYVGGSLVDNGGHNPIEPALVGMPVVCGPFQYNFADVMDSMARVGGLQSVTSAEDLARAVGDWLENDEARQQAAAAALSVVDRNRGAEERIQALICDLIDDSVINSPAT